MDELFELLHGHQRTRMGLPTTSLFFKSVDSAAFFLLLLVVVLPSSCFVQSQCLPTQ